MGKNASQFDEELKMTKWEVCATNSDNLFATNLYSTPNIYFVETPLYKDYNVLNGTPSNMYFVRSLVKMNFTKTVLEI